MFQPGGRVSVKILMFYLILFWSWNAVGGDFHVKIDETSEDGESELYNSDSWIDPGDMLATDLSSFTATYEKNEDHQEAVKSDVKKASITENDHSTPHSDVENRIKKDFHPPPNCDLPHFKQLTRIILESFPTSGKRYATIELSEDDLKMLQEFKDNDTEGERVSDALHLIIGIFKRIQEDERIEQTFLTRIFSVVEYNKEIFALFFIITLLLIILLIFESHTAMPWYRQCWYLFGLLFMVSIPWEWFRLYRKEFAEKQAELIKELPNHCVPKNMTIAARMSLWMSGLLSWSDDDCVKYQEAILVDPMWEISPSLALSTTATRLVFQPFEYIADSCGKSLRTFLTHIPSVWQPVMIILITVIILFLILLLTKSRIKFGFFELGPAAAGVDVASLRICIREELRGLNAPVRVGHLEEFPRIGAAVQEERRDDRVPRRVPRETESPVYPLPIKENVEEMSS